jgi:hypothetical protein
MKCLLSSERPHSITCQRTRINIFTVVKTPKLDDDDDYDELFLLFQVL